MTAPVRPGRAFTLRLSAHRFAFAPDGQLRTDMTDTARVSVPCESLEAAHKTATEFGQQNAPCVVWVGIANGRSPRGFEGWAAALSEQPFGQGDA